MDLRELREAAAKTQEELAEARGGLSRRYHGSKAVLTTASPRCKGTLLLSVASSKSSPASVTDACGCAPPDPRGKCHMRDQAPGEIITLRAVSRLWCWSAAAGALFRSGRP